MADRCYQTLFADLAYVFSDMSLLQQALTHRSADACHYERLEFLGDSILGAIIAHALYLRFPKAKEGQLSRLKASLVCGDSLVEQAHDLKLGDYIVLGEGERKSGAYRRPSILEDVLEALIGAIYLESGYQATEQVVLKLFGNRLQALNVDDLFGKDAKTKLQEYVQKRQWPLPVYSLNRVEGDAHEQTFYVYGQVPEQTCRVEGVGKSKKSAEQQAAMQLYQLIMEQKDGGQG